MDRPAEMPVFAYPAKFSAISGLSIKEVRKLCRLRIIPCERTDHGFRIHVHGALDMLRDRAMEFTGHTGVTLAICQPIIKSPRKKDKGFIAALNSLTR